MKYKNTFEFKKAIIVDEQMLRDIDNEIRKYYYIFRYEVDLKENGTITFETVDELVSFENSKINAIKNIHIRAYDKNIDNSIYIWIKCCKIFISQFEYTIHVSMDMDSYDNSIVLKKKLEDIFIRHEQDMKYNILSKTGVSGVISAVYIITTLVYLYYVVSNNFKNINSRFSYAIIFLFIVYIIMSIWRKLQEKFYPPIVFYLGDGISIYENNKNTRNNIFWGLIVAIIISIVFFALEIYASIILSI